MRATGFSVFILLSAFIHSRGISTYICNFLHATYTLHTTCALCTFFRPYEKYPECKAPIFFLCEKISDPGKKLDVCTQEEQTVKSADTRPFVKKIFFYVFSCFFRTYNANFL